MPHTYRDIFRILREEKTIDNDIEETMSKMVYYRNRLAHQYAGLNSQDIGAIVSNLDTVRKFVLTMKGIVQKSDQL